MADHVYVAVTNIPSDYHAADLRAHFSALVESKSFLCFHFRHRPEKAPVSSTDGGLTENKGSGSWLSGAGSGPVVNVKPKRCCVAKVVKAQLPRMLQYHRNHWTNADGESSEHLCNISTVTLAAQSSENDTEDAVDEKTLVQMPELNPPAMMPNGNVGTPTLVFLDMIQQCLLPQTFVKKLQLRFPKTQGKRLYGNVDFDYCTQGHSESTEEQKHKNSSRFNIERQFSNQTESQYLKDKRLQRNVSGEKLINSQTAKEETCKDGKTSDVMDNSLSTPRPALHSLSESVTCADETDRTKSADFRVPSDDLAALPSARERKKREKAERRETRKLMAEGIEERLIAIERRYHNDDDAEEWDRHEASEDDPSNQERNKERLYETEEETPWEKGGPGVVFYTDANFWQAREGDFDEQTTDDLDVDFSAYEEAGAGDKDIKDFLRIRQEERFRSGYDNTDRFSIGIARRLDAPKHCKAAVHFSSAPSKEVRSKKEKDSGGPIGEFEQFIKGVGRRIMESQGWQDGQGLGRSKPGIKTALVAEGQGPHNKQGLGYSEPSSSAFCLPGSTRGRKRRSEPHLISTVYDSRSETDPKVPLLQRAEATALKHRGSRTEQFTSS